MSSDKVMEFNIRYTVSELIQGLHFYKSKTGFRVGRLVLTSLLILLWLWVYTSEESQWYSWLLILFAFDVYFDITGTLRCYFAFKADSTLYNEPFEFVIDKHEGISVKTKTYEARRMWSGYTDYFENEKMFLLVSGKGQFTLYPKRVFASPKELGQFRDLIRNKIATNN